MPPNTSSGVVVTAPSSSASADAVRSDNFIGRQMNRLQDKVALVFGAGSSGDGWSNGKAAAVAYAREGARVVAIDRVGQTARETAEFIEAEHHHALAVQADVTDTGSVMAAVEQAI